MQSLYLMSVAFSCAMLVTLANVTTPLLQTTADSTDVSTSPVAETTVLSISTTQLSTSTPQLSTSSKLAASTTKMSTSTTGHSSQATTPMKSSAYVKKSTTSTHTKQSITSNVVSSTNPPSSPSNAIKPSSIPITVTTSSTAPSTSTSQTSPSPVTSTSQTSPTTSPVTSTSPSTATSTKQASPTTSLSPSRSPSTATPTKQASPTTSLSPSRSPSTATPTSQTSPISTTETTTISTTSTTETTTFVPRYSPADLSNTTVEVTLVVIVNGSFTDVPNNRSSQNYTIFEDKFRDSLTEFYKDILGNRFKGIIINGFSLFSSEEGSIKCNYTVELKAPTNKSEAKAVLDDMTNATWSSFNETGIPGPVWEVETRNEQTKVLKDVDILLHVRGGDNVCGKQAVLRYGQHNNGTVICVYKCDDINKTDCGVHGDCVVTYTGHVKCLCKDDKNNVYHGDSCKETVPVDGPTTVKTVVVTESLSRTDIIAIAAGTGGGLVLLLLISLVCVCRKLQSSKKRNKFYSYMGNDKEALHSENSRIENVPNIKNDHTNMAYVRDTDYMQLQRFEPEGKNVNHETGQRQGYERDEKSYRKVEAPDVGNVTIYQPSHLKEPIDRQSGASKFDREEVQSHPLHTMDTEQSYKIRRPTVNSDTSIPYN